MKKAFTLIELLVVVLIIGILSAIALPQYTKAVEKARMSQGLVIANALQKSVESYMLANSVPGTNEEVLGNIYPKLDVNFNASSAGDYDWLSEYGQSYRINDFMCEAYCSPDECVIIVSKLNGQSPSVNDDEYGEMPNYNAIDYSIRYVYTHSTKWRKYYNQKSNYKTNLKPDFAALGFTTN